MKIYPSKILLFGEYTILLNSDALAIPFQNFHGEWDRISPGDKKAISSNKNLKNFLDWILSDQSISELLNTENFESDLNEGLFFKSDIPLGSGLGSSGAVVAGIFDRYGKETGSMENLGFYRSALSSLENYFHSKSSGVDPLVSYLNKPLLVSGDGYVQEYIFPDQDPLKKQGLFLFDSHIERKTGDLVRHFSDRIKSDRDFLQVIMDTYIPLSNHCISSLKEIEKEREFQNKVCDLSLLQAELFSEMFPDEIKQLMKDGIEKNLFSLKLCGSGGGGYFIGFSANISQARQYFENRGEKIIIY